MSKNFNIVGKIIDKSSKKGLEGIRIEAWDKDLFFDDFLGDATTNQSGEFEINFSASRFKEWIFDKSPDVYFKLYKGKKFILDTLNSVSWNEDESTEILIPLDLDAEDEVNLIHHVVHGRVVYANDKPAEANVKVFEVKVNGSTIVGSAQSDENGNYRVSFRAPEDTDIQVKAFKDETEFAKSEVLIDIKKKTEVNLTGTEAVKGPSEYEEIEKTLKPLLNGIDVNELDANGIRYLAKKTGAGLSKVVMMARANQLSSEDVPEQFYYQLFRSGVGLTRDRLFRVNADEAIEAYKKVQGDLVPQNGVDLESIKKGYIKQSVSQILDTSSEMGVSKMEDMLLLSLPDRNDRERFVELYYHGKSANDPERRWEEIKEVFGAEKSEELKRDAQIGYLTYNNAPLIQKMKSQTDGTTDAKALIALGLYKAESMEAFIDDSIEIPDSIPGETAEEKRGNYVAWMSGQLQFSYPNNVVADLVDKDEIATEFKAEVSQALQMDENGFKIGEYSINKHIEEIESRDFQLSISAKEELRSVHRAFSLAPDLNSINFLRANNLDSCFKILSNSESQFGQKYTNQFPEGAAQAQMIYYKAQHDAGVITQLATSYGVQKSNPLPWILKEQDNTIFQITEAPNTDGIKEYPTLDKLFGSLDYCFCDHCTSILSPTAYLVDLFQFIDVDTEEIGGSNPIDELFRRRPDLEYSELTCENTNTVLPYIDLVNEILEYFVVNDGLGGFEGYNMDGDVTSDELMANPQFVQESAYSLLNGDEAEFDVVYPMNLPFNRNLELLRKLHNHLGTPLHAAMAFFRENEAFEPGSGDYSWRETLTEQIGISPKEFGMFTDHSAYSLQKRYGLESGDDLNDNLSNAKEISRILDITYEELVRLLKTEFINSGARLVKKLELLQEAFNSAKENNSTIDSTYGTTSLYEILSGVADENSSIISDLDDIFPSSIIDLDKFGGDLENWISSSYDQVKSLIYLAPIEGDNVCDFANLELRYADPANTELEDISYWKIIQFVRLWRKLGVTIEQTDTCLSALFDHNTYDLSGGDLNNLDDGIKDFLIKYALSERVKTHLQLSNKREYEENLALWSDINTYGEKSLYSRLFLNASVLSTSSVFGEDGYGDYLTDPNADLLDFDVSLQAAFSVTSDEWNLIVDDLNYDASTKLTLENVSAIYRIAFLARKLKISVQEFITLKELSGIDPFSAQVYEDSGDYQQIPLIHYLEMVRVLDTSDFSVQDLDYLFRHTDATGNSQPSVEDRLEFARVLQQGLKGIRDSYPEATDLDEAQAQALITSIYGNEFGGTIYSILSNTLEFSVDYDHSAAALEPAITAVSNRLSYDNFAKKLSYAGIMTASVRDALQAVAGVTPAFIAAVQSLFNISDNEYSDFFTAHPEFQALFNSGSSFEDIIEGQLEPLVTDLKKNYLRETLATELSLSVEYMENLLEGALTAPDSYVLNSSGTVTDPVMADYLALGLNGFSASYYDGTTIGATPDSEAIIDQLAFDGVANSLPTNTTNPAQNISASWKFYMEFPTNENYNLYLDTDAANVKLWVGGVEITTSQTGTVWENATGLSFEAGKWYEIEIQALDLNTSATFRWQRSGQLIQDVPVGQCFPYTSTQNYLASHIKLLKTVRIVEGLFLHQDDVILLSDTTDLQIGGSSFFQSLPVANGVDPALVQNFMERLHLMLEYSHLKAALTIGDGTLAAIIKNPLVTDDNGSLRLLQIINWDENTLVALIKRLTGNASSDPAVLFPLLTDRDLFKRVLRAFGYVDYVGSSVEEVLSWVTLSPSLDTCTNMQQAIRRRYDHNSWLEVIQPITDEMRKLQRDALISYILFQLSKNPLTDHINTSDKLYEYFLIDVDMSPCMKTSRTKQAISTTQLFIQRVLLNLEANVNTATINKEYWVWMKNYRVWEANRKVFLYPENWMEPSLRSTKSPFFKEFESELLQSDMNDSLAEVAMKKYLEKLDKVSNMTITGMCREDDKTIHVIGRNGSGVDAEYYHRKQSSGQWSAWEPINLDIGHKFPIPVIWKKRLFLFWTTTIIKGDDEQQFNSDVDTTNIENLNGRARSNVEININYSEHLNGTWQNKKTSNFENPVVFKDINPISLLFLRLYYNTGDNGELAIFPGLNERLTIEKEFFVLYNKHSEPQKTSVRFAIGSETEPEFRFPGSLIANTLGDYRTISMFGFGVNWVRPRLFSPSESKTHKNILDGFFFWRNQFNHLPHDLITDPFFVKSWDRLFFVNIEKRTTSIPLWVDFGTESNVTGFSFEPDRIDEWEIELERLIELEDFGPLPDWEEPPIDWILQDRINPRIDDINPGQFS